MLAVRPLLWTESACAMAGFLLHALKAGMDGADLEDMLKTTNETRPLGLVVSAPVCS